jgi:hypothetical protein
VAEDLERHAGMPEVVVSSKGNLNVGPVTLARSSAEVC